MNPLFALLLAGAVHGGLFARLNPNALPQPSARHEKDTVGGGAISVACGAVREAWIARYGGNRWDFAFAIRVDGSGNSYVFGTSADDYATIKYSPLGQDLWVARYDGGRR